MSKQVRYRAAGGIVVHDGEMLLLDRPGRREVRLPKGHIEEGESAQIAALRETSEEAGYADLVIVEALAGQVVEFDLEGEHIVRQEEYFLMDLRTDRQVSRSTKDAEQFFPYWVPLETAVDQLTYPAEKQIAQAAIQRYHQLYSR
jgi:8-oxo-dGTP pyrophosphatase MutT (NUDIX family)